MTWTAPSPSQWSSLPSGSTGFVDRTLHMYLDFQSHATKNVIPNFSDQWLSKVGGPAVSHWRNLILSARPPLHASAIRDFDCGQVLISHRCTTKFFCRNRYPPPFGFLTEFPYCPPLCEVRSRYVKLVSKLWSWRYLPLNTPSLQQKVLWMLHTRSCCDNTCRQIVKVVFNLEYQSDCSFVSSQPFGDTLENVKKLFKHL